MTTQRTEGNEALLQPAHGKNDSVSPCSGRSSLQDVHPERTLQPEQSFNPKPDEEEQKKKKPLDLRSFWSPKRSETDSTVWTVVHSVSNPLAKQRHLSIPNFRYRWESSPTTRYDTDI